MVALAALALLAQDPSPKDALFAVLDSYNKHETIALKIDRENTSENFPGRFVQELKWRRGMRFELVVTKPSEFKPEVGSLGRLAPDVYCNGERTLQVWPSGLRTLMPVIPMDTVPIWEETGDLVLTWLMGTPNKEFWLSQPTDRVEYKKVGEAEWRGASVLEYQMIFKAGAQAVTVRMFVSRDGTQYVGSEYPTDEGLAWVQYTDQRFGLELPETLGDGPKPPATGG